jgi:hypothetical protein
MAPPAPRGRRSIADHAAARGLDRPEITICDARSVTGPPDVRTDARNMKDARRGQREARSRRRPFQRSRDEKVSAVHGDRTDIPGPASATFPSISVVPERDRRNRVR